MKLRYGNKELSNTLEYRQNWQHLTLRSQTGMYFLRGYRADMEQRIEDALLFNKNLHWNTSITLGNIEIQDNIVLLVCENKQII